MTCQRTCLANSAFWFLLVVLFVEISNGFRPFSLLVRQHPASLHPTLSRTVGVTPLASSFYGKFDDLDDDDDEDDDDDDDDDYDLDNLDVDQFRSKMSSLFGEDDEESSSDTTTPMSTASSVDELISFARSRDPQQQEQVNTDWATPTDKLEPGTVLLANPAKFCADFGNKRSTPSPSLLAKFGLTLPPPADLGADRRADLLPVLMIVSTTKSGGFQAVLLNRRTG